MDLLWAYSHYGTLLWDIKEVQSLVILERITSLMTSHYVYILLLIGGLVLGGLLAMFIHRKEKDNQENINLLGPKRNAKDYQLRFDFQDCRN